MKFRTLGVALLMGSGLALSAVAASPAVAQNYPPAGCVGPFGNGTVTPVVVEVGDEVIFSGCGFEPATIVQIAVDGIPFGTVLAEADTTFSIILTFDTPGQKVLTATGQQALFLDGVAGDAVAELSTGGATGVEAVPAQAPYLTRVVTGTALVNEDDDKPDWPHDGGWGHGGWGGPTGQPSYDPSASPTPSGSPTGTPTGTPTVAPTGTVAPTSTVAPTAAPTVAPVETVTPPHHARPPHHQGGLPFTGVETGALAAIAVALVGGGLLIRVAARKRRNVGGTHS